MDMRIQLVLVCAFSLGTQAQGQTLVATGGGGATGDSVAVFLDGNAKTVFGQAGSAPDATGTLGLSRWGGNLFLSAQISLAAKSDTVRSGYGATMLTPSSGKALNSGILLASLSGVGGDRLPKLGVKGYLSVSTHIWGFEDTTPDDAGAATPGSFEVPIIGFAVGPFYSLVDGYVSGKKTVVDAYAALSARRMYGDLANSSREDLRMAALDTTDEGFWGFEAGLNLQFGNIGSSFVFYFFDADVPGLTDGQVAAGVSLSADLVRDALTPND